jgi:uncharacterized membrane protein HdeD (DUF308 family)
MEVAVTRNVKQDDVKHADVGRHTLRTEVRNVSATWWQFLILGVLWIVFGTFVLTYQVGSLAAVAGLVGTAFLFGSVAQLVVATRVQAWRWMFIISGILGLAAGIMTLLWPGSTLYIVSIMVAWYLVVFGIVHLVEALAGPKLPWWWTGLLLGVAELVLGVWALRSWEGSLLTLITLVGAWALFHGVNEIFAAFSIREIGKRAEPVLD